jgi:hypothetical protein
VVSNVRGAPIVASGPLPERMRRLKLTLSWLIVALGCLAGLLVCMRLGFAHVSSLNGSPDPHLAWCGVAGVAVLGLALLVSSLVAVRHRKTAGFILLGATPVGAACLAYAASDYGMWLGPVAGFSVPFLLPGLFWVLTEKRGWPSLVQDRPRTFRSRVSGAAVTCVAVLCLDVVLTVILSGLGSSLYNGDCGGPPPYRRAAYPTHAVFTARVIFAGRSIEARRAVNGLRSTGPDDDVGDWAIGLVEENFWGLPRWTRVVLLTNNVYWKGETYFVDGGRADGLLTQLLPIVEGGVGCSRTRPVQYAAVDLRVLRRPSPQGATRVTGVVRGPETFTPGLVRPRTPVFVSGARIDIVGSTWTRTIATDAAGVYELDGLPPGDYTLRLSAPETQAVGFFRDDGSPTRIHLDPGGLVLRNFELFWDGRIEGKVHDASGAPARAWVELVRADGRQLPGFVEHFEMTAEDGSYRFHKIPRGRYLVVVNPGGPGDEWPHDIQYYPGTDRKEQAHVFDLADGQRVSGVDVRAPPLTKRVLRARVIRADGTPVAGASVCVAYDKTDDYEALAGRHCSPDADQDGYVVISTYGESQVRIFAQQFVFGGDEAPERGRYRSQPIQYAADQIPNGATFVLNSANRP